MTVDKWEIKKLHEIDKGSKIHCDVSDESKYVTFNKIDGMYSHCTSEKGNTIHLSASTPLVKHKDGYRIYS